MSESIILDRELAKRGASRELTAEERAHHNKIAENYRRLILEGAVSVHASEEVLDRPEAEATESSVAPAAVPSAAERIASYSAVEAAPETGRRVLFEGLSYRDGELVVEVPTPTEETVEEALAIAETILEPDADEDALPTRRTMETIRQAVRETSKQEAAKSGLFAALSTKTKVALAVVAAVIVIVLAIIGINTGIIRSLDASILTREETITQLTEESERILGELEGVRDPDAVLQWATERGMTRS